MIDASEKTESEQAQDEDEDMQLDYEEPPEPEVQEEEDVVMECIIVVNNRGDGDNGSKYLMTYVVLSLS